MKDYLLLLTKYHRDSDNEVIRIFDKISEEERRVDRKSFAVSLHGILDHIMEATLYFQKQIYSSFPTLSCLFHKYIAFETVYGKINFYDFEELKKVINTLDAALIEIVRQLSEEDLNKQITVKSFDGESIQTVNFIIFQCINHSTHHRGQISQILDEMKVDNDYSGIHLNYE